MEKKSVKLETQDIARALRISEVQVTRVFTDGRVAAQFGDLWASEMFGRLDGNVRVRMLTDGGVRFQDSRFIGAGRTCSMADLVDSVTRFDYFLVVDVRRFPDVTVYKLRLQDLQRWVQDGILTPSGLTPERFSQLLGGDDDSSPQLFKT